MHLIEMKSVDDWIHNNGTGRVWMIGFIMIAQVGSTFRHHYTTLLTLARTFNYEGKDYQLKYHQYPYTCIYNQQILELSHQ
jgi:hypothetical protein